MPDTVKGAHRRSPAPVENSTSAAPRHPLHDLLVARAEAGWLDRGTMHILRAGPSDQAIDGLGFSPLINPKDGSRYGDAAFRPFWSSMQDHGGWFEMGIPFCDGDFTVTLFIEDQVGVDPALRKMCREFAQ